MSHTYNCFKCQKSFVVQGVADADVMVESDDDDAVFEQYCPECQADPHFKRDQMDAYFFAVGE